MSHRNSQDAQQSTPPLITVRSSPESIETAKTFLLVFQRYLAESDEYQGTKQIPPLFVEGLLDHVLEHRIELNLDDTFQLRIGTGCDSTATKAIFGFSIDQDKLQPQWRGAEGATTTAAKSGEEDEAGQSLIGFRVARKWDGDIQVVDVRTGDTKSEGGHWMSSREDRIKYLNHRDILPPGGQCTAKEILREYWIAPHKWWNTGDCDKKATLVRPTSVDCDLLERYCPAAQKALSDGYTLFMARSQNDLIQLELPGRNSKVTVFIAGVMWQEEGSDYGTERNNSNSNNEEDFNPRSACDLKFIIPERSIRRAYDLEFQDGIIVWNEWDEYKYIPGYL